MERALERRPDVSPEMRDCWTGTGACVTEPPRPLMVQHLSARRPVIHARELEPGGHGKPAENPCTVAAFDST
ncbi:hypothetical protein NDU88_002625 [Pleurodeles waltl]|uniref:Uncharacterized protein n=1 Tax=Pleurodeles waltl TaxID=8319 RepID=A0AAV7TM64_PLEWA|nr:hypothetical protein NDU88_002625 [Pleurodeles waltl]